MKDSYAWTCASSSFICMLSCRLSQGRVHEDNSPERLQYLTKFRQVVLLGVDPGKFWGYAEAHLQATTGGVAGQLQGAIAMEQLLPQELDFLDGVHEQRR